MKSAVERRKLHIIEEFLNISNEKIIAKINRRMKNNFLLGTKPKSIQKKFSLTNN